MKRGFFVVGSLVALSLAAVAAFVLSARAGWLTPTDEALRARYARPESQFMDVDGVPVHYVDQGRGPAIVLVHGSFGSLRMWDDWAAQLSANYRVVRFDRPRMGLSGPASVGHSSTEHELRVIEALATRLGLPPFFLAGTSSAGVSVAAYAAQHPDRVRGLILSNIAVGAFSMATAERPASFRFLLWVDPWLGGWRPRAFWRQVLLANFHRPERVTRQLAQEWSDLNNRAQRMPPPVYKVSPMAEFDRTADDLRRMSVPTLLLWSAHDHELPLETVGRKALDLLASQDKALAVVLDCGHMMPLECGPASAALARPFFDRLAGAGR